MQTRSLISAALPAAILLLGAAFGGEVSATKVGANRRKLEAGSDLGHADLMKAVHAARYAVNKEQNLPELGGKDGLVAYSRSQSLRTLFARNGTQIQAPAAHSKRRPSVRLSAASLRRGAATLRLPEAAPSAKGNRVEYARGPVAEWYVNDERGLEQGFTVGSRQLAEDSAEPLVLSLAVSGDLKPVASSDGQSVSFRGEGASILYSGLKSWDATGRELPSRMSVTPFQHPTPDSQLLSLHIEDDNAVYPITIDPTFSTPQKITAADPAQDDDFGISSAIDGDTAVVGAYRDDVGGLSNRGSAYVFVRSGGIWTQEAHLTASDGAVGDSLGISVAISGDLIVAGAYTHNAGGFSDSGAAYVFSRSGAAWSQEFKLVAATPGTGDRFGRSAALDGETAVIGAYWDDVGGQVDQGSAYIFVRTGATWTQQVQLLAADGAGDDEFGTSVDIDGDVAVVGAPDHDVGGNSDQGSAYVYNRSGSAWNQLAPLTGIAAVQDDFGTAVRIDDETIIVGADSDFGAVINQGSAYVFVRTLGVWSLQTRLIAPDGASTDFFGTSLAVSGDTAVIGALSDNVGGVTSQGSVYVYSRTGTTWTLQDFLTAPDGATNDFFARSLALSGNTLIVGANSDDHIATNAGSAYVFDLVSGQQQLLAPNGLAGDQSGFAVAVDGTTAVVGAPFDDGPEGIDQGTAYVFNRHAGFWSFGGILIGELRKAQEHFGASVAIDGIHLWVGAPEFDDDDTLTETGRVYLFERESGNWVYQGKLANSNRLADDQFGISLAIDGNTAIVGAHRDDDAGGANQGTASVYTFANSWSLQTKLVAQDGEVNSFFGRSVALSGDTVLVGAYGDSPFFGQEGSAYVFVRSGITWSQQVKLLPSTREASAQFGFSVGLSGNSAVVGSHLLNLGGSQGNQGSAFVFARTGVTWAEEAQLRAADALDNDLFGVSVAISDGRILVGARGDDIGGVPDAGSAHLFERSGGVWRQTRRFVAPDYGNTDQLGVSVDVSEETAIVGANLDDAGANADQGSAYVFEVVPYAPEQLIARAVSSGRIDLTWLDGSGIEDGFEIEFATNNGALDRIRLDIPNLVEMPINNLIASTEYFFRVRAFNREADGPWSGWVSATTLPDPPAAPSGLYATVNNANALLMRWTDNANNEDGFHLQRSVNRVGWTQILDGTSNTVQFNDTGLTADLTYYYRVRAYNSSGFSSWSEVATGVTRPAAPAAPSQLAALATSNSQILLTWRDNSNNENEFRLFGRPAGSPFAEIARVSANTTTFAHIGLTQNTRWDYVVQAINAGGVSANSNTASATTLPTPPTAPSGLVVTPLSNRVVAVSWTDNSNNETEFRLERREGTAPFAQIAVIVADGTSYFDSAVAPSTNYTYRLRAANAGGTSAYTSQVSGATPAGVTDGELQVRPSAIRFNGVKPGQTATKKLTIANAGKGNLKVVVAQLAPPFTVIGTRTLTLRKKEQRILKVRYDATAESKGATATLGIAGSGRKQPVVYLPISAD